MQLIALKRFGKYRPGDRFSVPSRAFGKALIAGKIAEKAPKLSKLPSYSTRVIPAEVTHRTVVVADAAGELKELRSQFRAQFGRPPHHTWDADKLREKLAG